MVALLDSMTGDHPARPCVVLSNVTDAGGLALAAARGVPTVTVPHQPFGGDRSAFEAEISRQLAPFEPDLICLAGFMRQLTAGFVDQWRGRMLNIHPSLLPKYRGLHTHARVLDAGDAEHGCTVHEVTAALDDGPILGQARLSVQPGETPQSLAARVLQLEHRLYPAVLRRFVSGERSMLQLAD